MNISPIAHTAILMKAGQTAQALTTSMVRQAADQQTAMAQMLSTNVKNAPGAGTGNGNGTFSTYA